MGDRAFHSLVRPIAGHEVSAAFADTTVAEYHWYTVPYYNGPRSLTKAHAILNTVL